MGISCGATLIKYLLFLFNVIWLLLGGVILWLGFKIALWGGDLKEIWSSNLQTGAIVVLAAGFLIFILAFLGCCGAIKQNSCMLTTYGALILVLVILQCVGAYFAFANKGKLEGEFTKALTDQFHKWNGSQDKDVQRSIQLVQQTFQCCGITDYAHEYGADVPSSCCDAYTKDVPNGKCKVGEEVKYKTGCKDKVVHDINTYLNGLGAVAIGLVLIQLLIIVSACCLAREVR